MPTLPRIGHGYDLHRLRPGGRLVLAGVEVAANVSPVAHSDGDVVLHAVVDALCGALGLGDIGEHFPDTDPQWENAPSRAFVDAMFARVTAAGYVVGNVDVTVLAERPRLKAFKPAMRESLAALLRIPPDRANVKAGTNEGCDAIGRGEAIAAHAVVLLVPSSTPGLMTPTDQGLRRMYRDLLATALAAAGGDRAKAASILGVPPERLARMLAEHHLD